MLTSNKPKLLEKDIENTCSAFLAYDGWRCLKTDPVSNKAFAKGFGEKGMADCLYIRYETAVEAVFPNKLKRYEWRFMSFAQVMFIEWKRKGGKAKQRQLEWHTLERKRGALTLIAGIDFEASINGFEQWYRASGLMRRRID